jgi:hypothetical protein
VTTRWRFLESKKSPLGRPFQVLTKLSVHCLVAGIEFEPMPSGYALTKRPLEDSPLRVRLGWSKADEGTRPHPSCASPSAEVYGVRKRLNAPNRLTTQRRLLQRAGAMRMGAAMMRVGSNLYLTAALSGLTPRFLGVVRSVGPAGKGGRVTLDIRGAKNLHQGRS